MPRSVSRAELYHLVWNEPLRDIAERFGVSDVALRKACIRAAVPTPKRGYWAKRNAGIKQPVDPLPPPLPGMTDAVGIGYGNGDLRRRNVLKGMPDQIGEHNEPIDQARKRFTEMVGHVVVPERPSRWHPAVERLFEADRRRAAYHKSTGLPALWDQPHYGGPFERRRLRLLNALFHAVARLGGKSKTDIDTARRIVISFDGVDVCLGLDAPKAFEKKGPPVWTYNRYGPVEGAEPCLMRMAILSGSSSSSIVKSWEDVEPVALETRIAEIAVEVAVQAEEWSRSEVAGRNRRKAGLDPAWEAWQLSVRESAAEEERQAVTKIEKARVDRLLQAAEDMRKAQLVRQFVDEIEATAGADPDVTERRLATWVRWAREKADKLDPAIGGKFLQVMNDPVEPVNIGAKLDALTQATIVQNIPKIR